MQVNSLCFLSLSIRTSHLKLKFLFSPLALRMMANNFMDRTSIIIDECTSFKKVTVKKKTLYQLQCIMYVIFVVLGIPPSVLQIVLVGIARLSLIIPKTRIHRRDLNSVLKSAQAAFFRLGPGLKGIHFDLVNLAQNKKKILV